MNVKMPLVWPQGWPRVQPEHQIQQKGWKKPMTFYQKRLEEELTRMGATSFVLTFNDDTSRDSGVCVWWARKRKEDFSWRSTLEITVAYPTLADVSAAYRKLAQKYHTDNLSTGDLEIFHKISEARVRAEEWVNQKTGASLDFALAADKFTERRLNVASLAFSVRHMRGIEKCGTSAIMERSFGGFAALPEGGVHVAAATP